MIDDFRSHAAARCGEVGKLLADLSRNAGIAIVHRRLRRPVGDRSNGAGFIDAGAVGTVAPKLDGKTWITADRLPPTLNNRVYVVEFWSIT